jgi:hypothetical protein
MRPEGRSHRSRRGSGAPESRRTCQPVAYGAAGHFPASLADLSRFYPIDATSHKLPSAGPGLNGTSAQPTMSADGGTSNVSTIEICLVRSACHSISSAQWPLRPKNRQSVRDANDPIENLLAVERKSS